MKICIIGKGSIGIRHKKIFEKLGCNVYFFRSSNKKNIRQKFLKEIYNYKDLKKNKFDLYCICNPTSLHFKTFKKISSYAKNVFVEKPLALTIDELEIIDKAYQDANTPHSVRLMVGFNRRYAPHIVKMKGLLSIHRSPKTIIITVNAGAIPGEHWVQNALIGGGRIIGEGCHFIDLMRHLVGHKIIAFKATMMGAVPGVEVREDKASITLTFEDGSFGTILYLANGSSDFPKERIEVFTDGKTLQLDNFRKLKGFGWKGFKKMNLWSQDKGQSTCAAAFIKGLKEGVPCIPADEIFEVARVTIEANNILINQ